MTEQATRDALSAAAKEWMKAAAAVSRWRQDHIAFWWTESGEPPPPEPKVLTRQAIDEYNQLKLAEQEAQEEFFRISRDILSPS